MLPQLHISGNLCSRQLFMNVGLYEESMMPFVGMFLFENMYRY